MRFPRVGEIHAKRVTRAGRTHLYVPRRVRFLVRYLPRADDPRQCEIGFTITPRYQGRGYATEAVRLLVGYLFARGKHRVTACCDARNAASAAVLERLAMRREGHLRQSTWAKGGWTDDLLYALLRDEWQTGRG